MRKEYFVVVFMPMITAVSSQKFSYAHMSTFSLTNLTHRQH